ncbi:3-isopropylmalate dehydratase, large subunit [Paraburkholderia fungorum]|uniref:3-isopropylmalate dehydratase n=1 Tax=Paraburkholderia fungorum TaxID=134537 RepID=A0A1H1JZR1_9BURK|nr:3-isopropylmalate dehydratase large subunit [Paraburkholderia fungorum]SDR55466.1 3-isopropylmalate dehydratase, large subunit [Paraburkholderia fungorum]
MGSTFFEKVWNEHIIHSFSERECLLAIDRLVLHDMSGSEALFQLDKSGRVPIKPEMVFSTVDHFIATFPGRGPNDERPVSTGGTGSNKGAGVERMAILRNLSNKFGVNFADVGSRNQGITHVMATEAGIALPGLMIVCGDSHTSTIGGIGAVAWGIGASEAQHVAATQTILQTRPKMMRVTIDGVPGPNTTAKDIALHLIRQIGAQAGVGYAVEFAGSTIRDMPIEGRLTLCNMAIEFSAKMASVPPDEKTFAYLKDRQYAPKGAKWDEAVRHWRTLRSDDDAVFDTEIHLDVTDLKPQVTWGLSPQHTVSLGEDVPDPAQEADPMRRAAMERALAYMQLTPGEPVVGLPIDVAYIGTCTNARLSDLREAAKVLKGHKVAAGIQAVCVPGSSSVRAAAEAEGIDKIFIDAGFVWNESGCFGCTGMPSAQGARTISSANRNFENRGGLQTRTHLASPATVAASALAGRIANVRDFETVGV